MFWNSDKNEEDDQRIAQDVSNFVDELDNPKELYSYLRWFLVLNIVIWLLVSIFPNYFYYFFERFFDSNKFFAVLLGIPFGAGLFLAYLILRILVPDVEENKTLESDVMGSLGYQSAANKRYYVWLGAILAGIFNLILMIVLCNFLVANELYLFGN